MGSQRGPEGLGKLDRTCGWRQREMQGGDGLVVPPGMVQETGRKDQIVLSCFRSKADLKLEPQETWSNWQWPENWQKLIQPEIRMNYRVITWKEVRRSKWIRMFSFNSSGYSLNEPRDSFSFYHGSMVHDPKTPMALHALGYRMPRSFFSFLA